MLVIVGEGSGRKVASPQPGTGKKSDLFPKEITAKK